MTPVSIHSPCIIRERSPLITGKGQIYFTFQSTLPVSSERDQLANQQAMSQGLFQSTLPVSSERDIIGVCKILLEYCFNPLSLYHQREMHHNRHHNRHQLKVSIHSPCIIRERFILRINLIGYCLVSIHSPCIIRER